MKRTAAKLVSILLIAVMCFSMFPAEAYAWGKMTHTYTANLIHDDLTKTGAGTSSVKYAGGSDFNFAIPQEFLEAIREYPDMFRAGALGPDMYPDILTGQMYIHPEDENVDSGEWVKYLCDSVNKMGKNTAGRKSSLAFTLGCIFHYCGDLFGHDFINTFSGGAFPSVASIEMLDITSERLNNVMSHLAAEKYMDELLYPDYDVNKNGKIDAPTKFVSNVMVFNGTPAAGLAPLYQKYPAIQIPFDEIDSNFVKNMLDDFFDEDGNNVPPHYTAMNALRAYVTSQADKYREHMEPVSAIITRYCDEWAADVDRGTIAFTTACDNIARRMVTKEKNPLIEEKKEEEEKSEYNSIVLFTYEQMKEMAKQQGVTDAQLKAVEEASKLGVDGHSFMDEVIRELVLKGVITQEMLNQEDSSITIIKEELGYWWDEYGVYMLGIPDIIIDGIEIPLIGDIVDLLLLGPLWDLIKYEIKKVAAEWVASACIGMISDVTGLSGAEAAEAISKIVSKMNDRIEDPELQLDHEDNPYKPSENNFEEFQKYMEHLKNAQNLNQMQDTDFEALYNTIAMFKLVLMGPDVYKMFVENRSGVQPTAYQKNIAHVEASALKLQIRTSNLCWAGTDDNIYVIVYKINKDGSKTELTCKLLDKSGYNDFECGDDDEYLVELPKSVRLDEIEIALKKTAAFDFAPSITDDWRCANIVVTPMYAGYEVSEPIHLGGIHMQGICNAVQMCFPDALKVMGNENPKSLRATNLRIRVEVADKDWAGSDSDIYVVANSGILQWSKVCLDQYLNNDLERGETEIYDIPITKYINKCRGVPLDELELEIKHEGSDLAKWKSLTIVPYCGDLPLIEGALQYGETHFESCTWKLNAQNYLKNATYAEYDPVEVEYETNLDGGLLSYMGSLDGGEEWVDSDNELWANTTLRKSIFFKIFKGFEPEIEYVGKKSFYDGSTPEILLNFTGVWNGVSMDRRLQVKDLQHNAPVKGSVNVSVVHENGTAVYQANGASISDEHISIKVPNGNLPFGYYDLKISYAPDYVNPMYAPVTVTIKRAFKYGGVGIMEDPQDATVTVQQAATLTVVAAGGQTPYAYTWQTQRDNGNWIEIRKDDPMYTGQGTDTLTLTSYVDGVFPVRCMVKDAEGDFAVSAVANVTVTPKPLVITEQPKDVTVIVGETAALKVAAADGKTPYTYTWQLYAGRGGWADLRNTEEISGQGTPSLKIAAKRVGENSYRCIVKDCDGRTVTSDVAKVTTEIPPLVVKAVQPTTATVEGGKATRLRVEASGGEAPYTYTWQVQRKVGNRLVWSSVNNTTAIQGQGTPTLTYTPSVVGTSKFHCVVKDASGQTVISDTFSRTVKPLAVTINDGETDSIEIRAYSDEKVKLSANVTGGVGPYTYTWYNGVWGKVDGQWGYQWSAVPNTTSSYEATSIAIQNGQAYYARDNYQIKVEVKDATGTVVESDMVTVRITGIIN